jgi:hypothetical protein
MLNLPFEGVTCGCEHGSGEPRELQDRADVTDKVTHAGETNGGHGFSLGPKQSGLLTARLRTTQKQTFRTTAKSQKRPSVMEVRMAPRADTVC